ncbi:MAG: hypothetical protein QM579_08935 [Desulfovibrio sp.]|uniref:hypothetical protein n=1 Tax=Desulfovibrio sp. TaxID=885 RepID=UPI0039E46188
MKEDVFGFIRTAILRILTEENSAAPVIEEKTPLMGKGGILSSLMLVELMLVLEEYCTDNNRRFVWVHDSIMSEKNSPYHTVGTLVEYICSLSALGQEE